MKTTDKAAVIDAIDNEGFDYTFKRYSNFDEIKDAEFHRLRSEYVEARDNLAEYIGLDD